MSSLTLGQSVPCSTVVSQIADCTRELSDLAGDGCLVETPESRLVAHQLNAADLPSVLVGGLIAGELSGLHRSLTARRTTGLLPSGPVVQGRLGDRTAVFLALRADEAVGGAWLLPSAGHQVCLEALKEPVQRLTDLLAVTSSETPSLAAVLDGAALPTELAGADRCWVARFSADVPAEVLLRSLSRVAGPVSVLPVRRGTQVYAIVAAARSTSAERALAAVRAQCDVAAARLDATVTAGLSSACAPDGLVIARAQADAATDVAPVGSCVSLASVRSMVVARHLALALDSLPDLGIDPLSALVSYDRRRNSDLVETLRVWLDACGDVASATSVLSIHGNTLRYRMRRIEELTGLDLSCDADARLELQLRLTRQDLLV